MFKIKLINAFVINEINSEQNVEDFIDTFSMSCCEISVLLIMIKSIGFSQFTLLSNVYKEKSKFRCNTKILTKYSSENFVSH